MKADPPNKIDLMFDATYWERQNSRDMYIGVHNSKPDQGPVECTIRMREFHQSDLIPKDL